MLAQDGCQRLAEAQKLGRRAVASNAASAAGSPIAAAQALFCCGQHWLPRLAAA